MKARLCVKDLRQIALDHNVNVLYYIYIYIYIYIYFFLGTILGNDSQSQPLASSSVVYYIYSKEDIDG